MDNYIKSMLSEDVNIENIEITLLILFVLGFQIIITIICSASRLLTVGQHGLMQCVSNVELSNKWIYGFLETSETY